MKPSERVVHAARVADTDKIYSIAIDEICKILDEITGADLPSPLVSIGAFLAAVMDRLDTLKPSARVTFVRLLRERYDEKGEHR